MQTEESKDTEKSKYIQRIWTIQEDEAKREEYREVEVYRVHITAEFLNWCVGSAVCRGKLVCHMCVAKKMVSR